MEVDHRSQTPQAKSASYASGAAQRFARPERSTYTNAGSFGATAWSVAKSSARYLAAESQASEMNGDRCDSDAFKFRFSRNCVKTLASAHPGVSIEPDASPAGLVQRRVVAG